MQNLAAIWHYVRRRIPSHHDAQDVTSDVFARAWRSWPRYNPARGSVAAWLFTIAHHAVTDWQRKRGRQAAGPGYRDEVLHRPPEGVMAGDPEKGPEEALLDEELLAELQRSLARLSEREREALALRFAGNLRAAEVAAILGMTEGAVKMLVHRAILKLREEMAHGR